MWWLCYCQNCWLCLWVCKYSSWLYFVYLETCLTKVSCMTEAKCCWVHLAALLLCLSYPALSSSIKGECLFAPLTFVDAVQSDITTHAEPFQQDEHQLGEEPKSLLGISIALWGSMRRVVADSLKIVLNLESPETSSAMRFWLTFAISDLDSLDAITNRGQLAFGRGLIRRLLPQSRFIDVWGTRFSTFRKLH